MVANGVGIVDPDYCGPDDEVKIAVLNFTSAPVRVAAGDRIAQGMLLPVNRVTWEETQVLREDSREDLGQPGERGFPWPLSLPQRRR
jgi:dUTP pyrophosphatase